MKVGSSSGGGAPTNGSDSYTDGSQSVSGGGGGAQPKMQHLDSSFDGPSASNNGKPAAATAAAAVDNVSCIRLLRGNMGVGFPCNPHCSHTHTKRVCVCVCGAHANASTLPPTRIGAFFSMKMCMHICVLLRFNDEVRQHRCAHAHWLYIMVSL